jgi:hypothetical protein
VLLRRLLVSQLDMTNANQYSQFKREISTAEHRMQVMELLLGLLQGLQLSEPVQQLWHPQATEMPSKECHNNHSNGLIPQDHSTNHHPEIQGTSSTAIIHPTSSSPSQTKATITYRSTFFPASSDPYRSSSLLSSCWLYLRCY